MQVESKGLLREFSLDSPSNNNDCDFMCRWNCVAETHAGENTSDVAGKEAQQDDSGSTDVNEDGEAGDGASGDGSSEIQDKEVPLVSFGWHFLTIFYILRCERYIND